MPIYVVSRLTQCLGGVERCFVSCALVVMIALGVVCRGGNAVPGGVSCIRSCGHYSYKMYICMYGECLEHRTVVYVRGSRSQSYDDFDVRGGVMEDD